MYGGEGKPSTTLVFEVESNTVKFLQTMFPTKLFLPSFATDK